MYLVMGMTKGMQHKDQVVAGLQADQNKAGTDLNTLLCLERKQPSRPDSTLLIIQILGNAVKVTCDNLYPA